MDKLAFHGRAAASPVLSLALARALQSWDGLIERLPIGVYTCDRDGLLVQYNRRAAELWGRAPTPGDTAARFGGAHRAYRMSGEPLPLSDAPMAELLRGGQPVRDREVIIERPDGSRITVLANVDPLLDADGELIGGVDCFQDISELKRSQAMIREQERRHRDVLEALPAAIYTTDAAGRVTFYNEAAVELSGRRPDVGNDQWCVSWRLYEPDGTPLPHDQCPMAVALKEGRPVRGAEAVLERPDGTRVAFMPFPTPLRDGAGEIVGAVNMLVDVSDRKLSEDRLRLLASEVDHRANNLLALVQAAVRLTQAESVDDLKQSIEGRIKALAQAHGLLARSRWVGADLRQLVEEELAPYRGENGRVVVEGASWMLEPTMAQSMAVAIHELATNAAKYGALSTEAGGLRVQWHLGGDGRLQFRWTETGGPPATPPTRRGFGTGVVERMIRHQLGGEVAFDWRPEGVVCAINIPVRASARAE